MDNNANNMPGNGGNGQNFSQQVNQAIRRIQNINKANKNANFAVLFGALGIFGSAYSPFFAFCCGIAAVVLGISSKKQGAAKLECICGVICGVLAVITAASYYAWYAYYLFLDGGIDAIIEQMNL